MKKFIAIVLALAVMAALCSCGTSGTVTGEEAEELIAEIEAEAEKVIEDAGITLDEGDTVIAGLANPMVEYSSLEEINEIVGSALCHPPVMGVTDDAFFVINCTDYSIAQYNFSVNGNPFTFRCAPVMSMDISGIYVTDGTAFPAEPTGDDIEFCLTGDVQAARWFTMDGQYVLAADEPGNMDDDTFKMVAEELCNLTATGMSDAEYEAFYAELEGSWYYAEFRPTAEITANGSESATIVVHWPNSAFEYEQWTMTVRLSEDGLLYYNDLVAQVETFTSETESTVTTVEFPAEGWWSYSDGTLYWDGAGDESVTDAVFTKNVVE